tara:strand:+ start:468 stop:1130 length:663 start_codon:yes stop_codon:yes gene_type:complete
MNPFDQAWDFLKGTRQFDYDVGFDYDAFRHLYDEGENENKDYGEGTAEAIQIMSERKNHITPGPLPGFVYFYDVQTGDEKLMTESEAEKIWPSHIDIKNYMSPTKNGLNAFGNRSTVRLLNDKWISDPHFDKKETVKRFTEKIAPVMAHEVGHALDSRFGEGSTRQSEMPAHVLEMATRDVINNENRPILPIANRLVDNRNFTGEDDPNYEYDITDDTII